MLKSSRFMISRTERAIAPSLSDRSTLFDRARPSVEAAPIAKERGYSGERGEADEEAAQRAVQHDRHDRGVLHGGGDLSRDVRGPDLEQCLALARRCEEPANEDLADVARAEEHRLDERHAPADEQRRDHREDEDLVREWVEDRAGLRFLSVTARVPTV